MSTGSCANDNNGQSGTCMGELHVFYGEFDKYSTLSTSLWLSHCWLSPRALFFISVTSNQRSKGGFASDRVPSVRPAVLLPTGFTARREFSSRFCTDGEKKVHFHAPRVRISESSRTDCLHHCLWKRIPTPQMFGIGTSWYLFDTQQADSSQAPVQTTSSGAELLELVQVSRCSRHKSRLANVDHRRDRVHTIRAMNIRTKNGSTVDSDKTVGR